MVKFVHNLLLKPCRHRFLKIIFDLLKDLTQRQKNAISLKIEIFFVVKMNCKNLICVHFYLFGTF